MKKKLSFIILILFAHNLLMARSINCYFEEVYQNGQVQEGLILIQNNNIRYEYFDNTLYTLIYKFDQQLYLIDNQNRNNIQAVETNKEFFYNLIKLYDQYPNINDEIRINDFKFSIEKSRKFDFFKRIAVRSNQINLSLYFNNCEETLLDYKLFNPKPFKEITIK